MITVRTSDGKVYTDPRQVRIERNEKTEMFYRMVENYKPKEKKQEASA